MWDSFLGAFGALLAFFYNLLPNYGVTIVLVTVTIRLFLYPLTAKQARSMAAMQRLQPQIKKIQQKHKDDRQKLNEELMAFYKEHQINPLAGCLPLVLQFPVFIALFQVLRHPAKHIDQGTDLYGAFCPPEAIDAAGNCAARGLQFLSMDLSRGANADHSSFVDALPFFILIGLVIASGYLQSRQMASLSKGRATPQSQIMTRVFPVFFGLISYTLPAGVVLYFFVSNLWQIGQQAVVFGRGDDEKAPAGDPSSGSSGGKARGGAKPSPKAAVVEAASRDREPPADDAEPEAPAPVVDAAAATNPPKRPDRTKSKKRKKRKRKR